MQAKRKLTALLAFPVYAAGDAANDRFCGGCTGLRQQNLKLETDRNRLKSQLG